MDYRKIIKTAGYVQSPVESNVEVPSKMMELLREIHDKTASLQMPSSLEKAALTDEEVNDILETALRFQNEYFKDIPLSMDLSQPFIYNIPEPILLGIQYMKKHPDVPDILNPMMFMYLLLAKDPFDKIGLYWSRLLELINMDGNREAIDEDTQAYLADGMIDDDDDDENYVEEELNGYS